MKFQLFRLYLISTFLVISEMLLAQPAAEFDLNYFTFSGFDGMVNTVEPTPDGGSICGGYFSHYNRSIAYGMVKLKDNNEIDTTFHCGFNDTLYYYVADISPSIDGGYFIVGSFEGYEDVVRSCLVKINANGAIDHSFNFGGSGFDVGTFYAPTRVEQLPDGKILVSGSFTKYNGTSVHKIIRLMPDGTLDNTFYMPITPITSINDFLVLADGDILIGGKFTYTLLGVTKNNIEKLNTDGSVDEAFHVAGVGLNAGTTPYVKTFELTPDGKVLVGGNFASFNGVTKNRLVKINIDGTLDLTFTSATGGSGAVYDIIIRDGNIFYVGDYITLLGTDAYFGVLNSDGSANLAYPHYASASWPQDIALDASGKILIVGSFNLFNNRVEHCYIRLNSDATIDEYGNGFCGANGLVNDMLINEDGSAYIGGVFTVYDKYAANWFAKIHSNGTLDTTFSLGTGFNSAVRFIRKQADGKILIAGDFTLFNGATKNHMLRLLPDATIDPLFSVGTGPSTYTITTFKDIEFMPDGKIVVAGNFTTFGGVASANVVKLFNNGTPDISFTPASISGINKMTIQPDGKIILVGSFGLAGGISKVGVCRLNSNGTIDATYNTGTGGTTIFDSALLPDGKLIVVGNMITYDGVVVNGIARLLANGSIDTSFHTGTGASVCNIEFVKILPDGKILITGNFSTFNGIECGRMAVLNPDGTLYTAFSTAIGKGSINSPEFVAIENDGDFIISDGYMFQDFPYDRLCRVNYLGCTDIYDTVYAEINEGEVYVLPDDIIVTVAGTYVSVLPAGFGCDSIITTILTVIPLPCLTPGGILVSNITPTSARVSWTAAAGASQYNLWYRVTGVGGWTKKNVTVTTKKLTGLSPSTTYEYKLRTKCGATYSAFSAIGTFTTLPMREGEVASNMDVAIFPNPGHGIFTVEIPEDQTAGELFVFDITGKCVYSSKFQNTSSGLIDLSNCASGIYTIKLISNYYIGSTNLIIQ